MKADKILINGTIYDGRTQKPFRFLALSANRILAVGRGSGKQWIGRKTEIIDLRGLFVIPGLVDSHLHFLDYALSVSRVKLDACRSQTDITNILADRATRLSPGEWVLGRGWRKTHFGGFPHRKILDELFPDHPVVLNSHDEHSLWLNSQAIRAVGITGKEQIPGAYVGLDSDGTPDGIIGENAIPLVRQRIPAPEPEARKNALLAAQNKLHTFGIVGLHNTDGNQAFGDLQELHSDAKLKLRIFHSIPLRHLEDAVRMQMKSGLGDSWFRFGFVKIFSDGALGSQTARMLEPYNEVGGIGIETISEVELTEKIGLALQNGIAVGVHAIGDRANRQTLNAFEKNAPWLPIPRARSRIEHVQLLHPDDIPRFRKIGIIASMQPYHAISDCENAERFWGDRARYSYAWRSLLQTKAHISFGSDAPVEDPNPLPGLDAAVRRSNWADPSQRISAFDALRAYTWTPVFASGEESQRGSLEPGKLADFVILSDDPYQGSFDAMKVLGTSVNGEFVYREF